MANIYSTPTPTQTMTPQSQPIPGRDMLPNNAGGWSFRLDDWQRLHRFLITGSEGGTYYVQQRQLTEQNTQVVIRCIKADGIRVVREACEINVAGRAPKTDQQLFVLALALKHGDVGTRRAAVQAGHQMLRIGTHVLHLAAMIDSLKGWGCLKKRIFQNWYLNRNAGDVAFQTLKYQNRDGWSQKDVLRLVHPKACTSAHDATFAWVTDKLTPEKGENLPYLLRTYIALNNREDLTLVQRALAGINASLPREALPTEALADPVVWRALLPQTPPEALLRNLGVLTANGVLAEDNDDTKYVVLRLRNTDWLRRARIHPFKILLACLIYGQGHSVRGDKTWTPVRSILSAVEDAYDAAFDNCRPTGKRILIAVDISSSMSGYDCIGTPIKASIAASAMALTLARIEPHATVVHFDTAVRRIVPITRRTGIASIAPLSGGGTDLSSPVRWTMGENIKSDHWWGSGPALPAQVQSVDAFIVLTDNETWCGKMHPSQALAEYRRQVNPDVKLVCCSMVANHADVIDPEDGLSLGCAGLDGNLPNLIADFLG